MRAPAVRGAAPLWVSVGGLNPGQWIATLGVSAVGALTLVAAPAPWVAFGLFGVAALAAFGLIRPALFLSLFLLVRPLLDEFSTLDAGVQSTNVAGAFGLLLVGVTLGVLAFRRQVVLPPTTLAFAAVLAVSAVGAAQAIFEIGPAIGFRPFSELVRLLALIAGFVLAATLITSPTSARKLFVLVGMSGLIPAAYGVWELIVGVPAQDGIEARISGTFTGPGPFGAFLAFTALVLIFGPVQRLATWIRWPTLAIMLVALAGSYSRAGWVLFVFGLLILGWPARKGLVAATVAALILIVAVVPSIRERALPVGDGAPTAAASSGGYESYDWRISNWEGLLTEWSHRPLIGYGLESTTFVNPRSPVGAENRPDGGYESHNLVVRILVEGGLVLLAAYLFLAVAIMRRYRRLARERWELAAAARLLYVNWGLIFFAGLTTDDPIQLTALMVAVTALTGAVEGVHHRRVASGPQGAGSDRVQRAGDRHPAAVAAGAG